ncbi:unnamed protein product [Brachionus calyciflorus]|uniref:RCC1-like domain-containing protein n=1 Tax=Brachionus calyciflorus TaxID=104777 RepID=A0A813YY74_9BILA|nr:unnamed protein product [Brachionus calyciflorus]
MSYNKYYGSQSGSYSQRSSTNVDNSNNNNLLDDVPEYGSAFVCGKSRFEEGKFHVRDDPIIEIACGDEHTGVVTERGRVFMFGSNSWGQLGLGHENSVDKPSCVKAIKHEKVLLIACGRNHTILATEKGNIYTFGSNSEGQLGLGEDFQESFANTPRIVERLDPQDWVMLAAGSSHSCALSKSGDVYVWGTNENGEIGLGRVAEQFYPKLAPLDFKVSFVACGYYHTAVISKKGRLYTTGSNEYFQLGHNDESKRFSEVLSLDEPITYASCGGHHSVILGASGRVYSFGDGSKGQLGNGDEIQKSKKPEIVSFFRKKKIIQVACGECHTVFVTENGELYGCGDNRYGKLGLSQKTYNSIQFDPTFVEKFKQLSVENVACGGCHMILVAKLKDDKKINDSDDSIREKGYSDRRTVKESPRLSARNNKSIYDKEEARKITKRNDSDEEDMEKTFNRTHTLTRENKFVPLSELNLKKAAEEKPKRPLNRFQNSDEEEPKNPYLRSKSNFNRPTMNSRFNDDDEDRREKDFRNSRTRTSSNSDDDFYKKKSFMKPPVTKPYENDYKENSLDSRNQFLSRPKIKIDNSDDSDNDKFKKPFNTRNTPLKPTSSISRGLSKFNAKSFSDDEAPKSSYLNERSRPMQKPNSTYLRESLKNDSPFPQEKMTIRALGPRRDTKDLDVNKSTSKLSVRESARQNNSSQNKTEEKPKEKKSKFCSIL